MRRLNSCLDETQFSFYIVISTHIALYSCLATHSHGVDGVGADDGSVATGEVFTAGETVIVAVSRGVAKSSHHSNAAMLDLNVT